MKNQPEAPRSAVTEFDPAAARERLAKWLPRLAPPAIDLLVRYEAEILKFNKVLSLFSSGSMKDLEAAHLVDSALACELIRPQLIPNEPLYDFGSGNGCPGLVFASLYPEIQVILVDRDQRKMEFCKQAASTLGLKNVSVQVRGIEELAENSVKNAVARGLAPFSKALLIPRKQMGKGAKFFHMKADGWANELASMPSQMFSHWSPNLLGKYRLPDSSVEMFVVLTDKTAD